MSGAPSQTRTALAFLAVPITLFGMFYVVLPIVGLREMAAQAPLGLAIFEHLWFGFFVGVGLLLYRRTEAHKPHAQGPTRGGRDLEKRRMPAHP